MPPQGDQPHRYSQLHEHVALIAKHEEEFLAQRSESEKLSDRIAAFVGSFPYVVAHVCIFSLWIGWNLAPAALLPRFDPFPFPLLDLLFAFEAILVASFILMRQSRMSRRSEERDHLMLQILMLTEREITALLGMERQVAESMGMPEIANSNEVKQMSEQTPIDEVAQIIKESLPAE